LYVAVITARATASEEFCSLGIEELQRTRSKVERLLEQFDQDWSIYEKGYVTELMAIEADARLFVTEAIRICGDLLNYEREQKRKGKFLFSASDEYNGLRNKLLYQLSKINSVANYIGQGRDDLDLSVLIVAEEVGRTVSANQSVATRKLCTQIQKLQPAKVAADRALLRKRRGRGPSAAQQSRISAGRGSIRARLVPRQNTHRTQGKPRSVDQL
jgi:hypothetical protein